MSHVRGTDKWDRRRVRYHERPFVGLQSSDFEYEPMSELIPNPAGLGAVRPDKDAEGARGKGRKRRKVSYLTLNKIDSVDYKDIVTLK